MRPWRFLEYHTEDGCCPIREWYAEQDAAVQANFDLTLYHLRTEDDWLLRKVKEFKLLAREHTGLGELRFSVRMTHADTGKSFNRKFRPVGIWRPDPREFVLLVGCWKAGRSYTPHGAFDKALRYKALLAQGRGSIHEYEHR